MKNAAGGMCLNDEFSSVLRARTDGRAGLHRRRWRSSLKTLQGSILSQALGTACCGTATIRSNSPIYRQGIRQAGSGRRRRAIWFWAILAVTLFRLELGRLQHAKLMRTRRMPAARGRDAGRAGGRRHSRAPARCWSAVYAVCLAVEPAGTGAL